METITPTERNAAERKLLSDAFEQVCPNVQGNPYIPTWPLPRQALFLGLHQHKPTDRVFEALYGGAAGGGKSQALLMALAQYAWKHPDFAGVAFRRTFTDLTRPGALLDRAMQWWVPAGVAWDGSRSMFRFPNGAKVVMSYLFRPNDHLLHQGAEYHLTVWDELTQWPHSSQYEYVGLSRVRRKAGSTVPLRTLCASNPGGPGHSWVMRKFIGSTDPASGEFVAPTCAYVPARLADNPYLDQDKYIAGLMALHPTVRQQLLNGDWEAREAGDYFRRDWFGPLLTADDLPPRRESVRIRWWDLAASERPEAARTAGVLVSRSSHGVRIIEHATAFRATPGKRDDLIVQQAQLDGHAVVVGLEIEPGSGGQAQFETLGKRLRALGFRVVGQRPRIDGPTLTSREKAVLSPHAASRVGKAGRADPVASCLERGYRMRAEQAQQQAAWHEKDGIRLVAGQWTQDFLNEVEGFPEHATCDLVDALSGAWAWLEAHPAAAQHPPIPRSATTTSSLETHPTERRPARARKFDPHAV